MAVYDAERIPWNFLMPMTLRAKARELAALNGLQTSQVMERLIVIALKDGYEFTELPRGVKVAYRRAKGERVKGTHYSLPLPLAEYLESVINIGYDRSYVAWALLTRGLEIVKSRESTGHGADLDSGKVGPRPEGKGTVASAGIYQRPMGTLPHAEDGGVEAMRRLRIGLLRQVSDSDSGDVSGEAGPTFGEATGYE